MKTRAMFPQQVYSFTSVRLDERGEIVARPPGQARVFAEGLGHGVALALVAVPGGTFWMGSLPRQGEPVEHPGHQVDVPPFWLGQHPVTQAQWQAVMGSRAAFRFAGPTRPAENVAWDEAARFCQRLARRTGRAYRLPSEAEWEYACRAGTSTPFAFGATLTTDVANYVGNHTYAAEPQGLYRHVTTEAGCFPPNGFGLHDLHGNVWEWCADAWHASYDGAPSDGQPWLAGGEAGWRVARGGCWHDPPGACRSAARLRFEAAGDDFIGFRVALSEAVT